MSPGMEALASVGITHKEIILIVLALVAALVIGMYWQIILPGAIIIFVGSFFFTLHDLGLPPLPTISPIDVKSSEVEVFDEHKAYLEDCINVAEYSKEKCENLWYQRGEDVEKVPTKVDTTPASHVELLDVDNQEYKQRREEAIAKPNAVVFHETYH